MGSLVLQLLEEGLLVAWRVELDYFERIESVDLVNVLLKLISRFCLDFLDLL